MSTPDGEKAFLHQLETTVRAELAPADDSAPSLDPEEALENEEELHDEVGLRSLLDAVRALEHGDG